MADRPDLSADDFFEAAQQDEQTQMAWEALMEGVAKSVASELVVVPEPKEILISGRLCRTEKIRRELESRLSSFGPVRKVEGFASVAKEAAQGAALLADGLAGGRFRKLVEVMEIEGASGTVLDHLYIKNAESLRQKFLA